MTGVIAPAVTLLGSVTSGSAITGGYTMMGGGLPLTIPKWLPDPQQYAIEQERSRHDQALYNFGEYAMFILLWRLEDHEAGLVARCSKCFGLYGKTAEAYGQSAQKKCDTCFGTTFEGGIKARIIRPSLWDANEELHREGQRGEYEQATATVQSTSDFRLRLGDFAFRANGTRWQMQSIASNKLRTGFMMPTQVDTPLGFNLGTMVQENESSVAFIVPPANSVVATLHQPGQRVPQDFTALEDINGSLLHEDVLENVIGS